MGKRNKQRRAAKRHARPRGPRPRGRFFGPGLSGGGSELRQLLQLASCALAHGEGEEAGEILVAMADLGEAVGRAATGLAVAEVFSLAVASAWEQGWQPAELARAVRRRRSPRHEEAVVAAIAAEPSASRKDMPREWHEQLQSLGAWRWWGEGADWLSPWAATRGVSWADALATAVESLSFVEHLGTLAALLPPPSEWSHLKACSGRRADDPVLERVRGLLAKAESTQFEAEAEALTAKAQELMARHAIDDAVARASGGVKEQPVARRLPVDDPYAEAKSYLLHQVAIANDVRSVWHEDLAMMTVVGYEADLDSVEVLFTSLLLQASRAMLAKGKVTDQRGRSRTRSFRQSFLMAFAGRIGERLAAATAAAEQDAEVRFGSSLLPALAGRKEAVDEAVASLFPKLMRARGPAVTNREGWIAGRVAAEMATLGPEQATLARAGGG